MKKRRIKKWVENSLIFVNSIIFVFLASIQDFSDYILIIILLLLFLFIHYILIKYNARIFEEN